MNARSCSILLAWALDLLALIAIAGTGEVRLEVFGVVAAIFAVSRFRRMRLPPRAVLGLLLLIVSGAVVAWFKMRFHPIIAAAYAVPLVHSTTWLTDDSGRNRGWRIGVGFIELVVASALTTEAYLFPTIFAFVIFGAVAASCNFLDAELKIRAPIQALDALPEGFVTRSLGLACLIFLCSLIIFPILPRPNVEGRGFGDFANVGYTESVNLTENLKFKGGEGAGQPVLWLYPRTDTNLMFEIFGGLIRGRSLEIFDGTHWSAAEARMKSNGQRYVKPADMSKAIQVDAVRAPMPSNALPVPYGTIQVYSGSGIDEAPFPRNLEGSWTDPSNINNRTKYSFAFFHYRNNLTKELDTDDLPLAIDLHVPAILKTERMERLAKSIFEGARTEKDKADRLISYLEREHFVPALGETDDSAQFRIPAAEKMHPLERFLFIGREGHCEWFASASAVLLRMAGVPTRLVAGFRIAKGPVGNVLTLTANDAHAWIEYWLPSKGWVSLDPTPRLLRPPTYFNFLKDGYEWVSAYWYRYLLSYKDRASSGKSPEAAPLPETRGIDPGLAKWQQRFHDLLVHHWDWVLGALLFCLLSGTAVYKILRWHFPAIFSIRFRVREGAPLLRRERIRMERLLSTKLGQKALCVDEALVLVQSRSEFRSLLSEWLHLYQELRFGRDSQSHDRALFELRQRYRGVEKLSGARHGG